MGYNKKNITIKMERIDTHVTKDELNEIRNIVAKAILNLEKRYPEKAQELKNAFKLLVEAIDKQTLTLGNQAREWLTGTASLGGRVVEDTLDGVHKVINNFSERWKNRHNN